MTSFNLSSLSSPNLIGSLLMPSLSIDVFLTIVFVLMFVLVIMVMLFVVVVSSFFNVLIFDDFLLLKGHIVRTVVPVFLVVKQVLYFVSNPGRAETSKRTAEKGQAKRHTKCSHLVATLLLEGSSTCTYL